MPTDLVSVGLVCADVMVRPVDALPATGTLALVSQLEMHVGGLAGVTAMVYSQLGGRAAFIGRVGNDGFGDQVLHAMESAGVDTRATTRSSAKGTSATVVMIREDGERTFLHHTGATAELTADHVDYDLVSGARMLHWGGPAVTPGLDGEPMAGVFRFAREQGVRTSLDTCYDGSGVWLPRIEPSLPYVDTVFASVEEARQHTGADTPEEMAAFFLARGAHTAVIKLGPEGLYAATADEAHRLPAHPVEAVVDTTGAGDSACAGFLYGMNQGWNLERCARLANAVGALSVQAMGGAEAISSQDDALALMD
jgi:sugar/nucleoside kinase (ribokinase family)